MPFGYHGCYLRVDLCQRTSQVVQIDEPMLRGFIGGGGLGTAILSQESSGNDDPLGESAPLLFVFSPLVGSPLTTSAKFSVLSKSPLTNRLNDSLSSSHFAIAGKKTGYDAICIVGKSESPVFIQVTPDSLSIEEATDLWGKSSAATAKSLRSEIGNQFRVAAIGPAGENLVRYATISNDGRHAGRGGLGAVMGSKKLKAIAVFGDRKTEFAHPDELIKYSKSLSQKSFGAATEKYRELGTVSNLLTFNRLGTLPTRNFQQTSFEGAEQIAPDVLSSVRTRDSCAACTIGCEHIFKLGNKQQTPVRMEYENLYALGPLCGISDPEMVLAASAYCDEVGIDTISAGASVAFAMESVEKGFLDEPTLQFGSGKALLDTLKLISLRKGVGEILAEGVRIASQKIGRGTEEFAIHVKGLELPGYEPRALQTMALGFAVGTRGADHNRSGAYQVDFSEEVDRMNPDDHAVNLAIETEDEAAVMDSLILCKFLRGVFTDRMAAMAEMLHLVTGWDVDAAELKTTAQRIVTAKKQFNIDQGWTPAEDTLPARFFETPIAEGASVGGVLTRQRLAEQIKAYNLARGWTADGYVPTASPQA
ncbi:aldehyde ferredoxin oxidoreductase family protein [Thalassoglobus polymorphus]|uniref:Putative oxidoreductase YdhV n=1 Tax=Thalassoglobus polymorphus TaxID=2527994 RepID=A0A517QU25_9PLAN|nr:aldehyde ferredoxin oxidoreductase family protein [Thalassoglobus polymorphus]QDT35141.1 putative oxidoreductase YdhV [Thalassoglobus polymorphus]